MPFTELEETFSAAKQSGWAAAGIPDGSSSIPAALAGGLFTINYKNWGEKLTKLLMTNSLSATVNSQRKLRFFFSFSFFFKFAADWTHLQEVWCSTFRGFNYQSFYADANKLFFAQYFHSRTKTISRVCLWDASSCDLFICKHLTDGPQRYKRKKNYIIR